MTNPVLAETGPLAPGQPIILQHYGGSITTTRGTRSRLTQTEAQLRSTFAKAGHNVWTPTPTNQTKVEFVVVESEVYRVIDEEREFSGFTDPLLRHDTTRYLLQDDPQP